LWCKLLNEIDYPGEYEIQNIYFKVYDYEKKLNYIIYRLKDKNIAYIQSKDFLEHQDLDHIDVWLFEDPLIWDLIDQLEYEWEKILLQ